METTLQTKVMDLVLKLRGKCEGTIKIFDTADLIREELRQGRIYRVKDSREGKSVGRLRS